MMERHQGELPHGLAGELVHGMAEIEPGVRLHDVAAGEGEHTAVLLHGFPQTWREWPRVIPPLVEAGYRVIAPMRAAPRLDGITMF